MAFFGLGVVAHSALFWVGQLSPKASLIIRGLYALTFVMWTLCLLFDRSVMKIFSVKPSIYYGLLVWYVLTVIIGVGLTWVLMA